MPGLESLAGWSPDGRVERDAHHAVRAVLEGLIGPDERLAAARAACRAMAAQGIVAFHENAAPHIGPEHEIETVRQAAAETGLHATVYWGELMAVDTARRLGVTGLAGDLVADGAFGSRTAALSAPYADRRTPAGTPTSRAEQVRDHVVACTEAGLQAGFHCHRRRRPRRDRRGPRGWPRRPSAPTGSPPPGTASSTSRCPPPPCIEVLARLGVVASVQPMFDGLWGGPDGMYAARLGERWRGTNPFRALEMSGVRAGLRLGLPGHAARPLGRDPGRRAPPRRGPAAARRARLPRPTPAGERSPATTTTAGCSLPATAPTSPSGTSPAA